MVQLTNGVQSSNSANDFILNATPSASSADFAQQLLTAIEGLLQKSGTASQFEIDIKPGQGQNSDSSQLTVTVKNTTPTGSQTSPITLMSAITPTTATPKTSSTIPTSTGTSPASPISGAVVTSSMNPDDAYWASQPSAVQALRNMPADQRWAAAQELAIQGYAIDVPIMVNGMDPLAIMIQRQIDGYTWVPSALQANIPVGPGMNYPGPKYDPNNPPAGSIKVTTDFAQGTNMQNPWISKQQITESFSSSSSATSTT